MNTPHTFADEPTRPLTAAEIPEPDASPQTLRNNNQEAIAAEELNPAQAPTKTLWRRMASPFYVFSAGPWLSVFTLVILGTVTLTLLALVLPAASLSLVFLSSGVLIVLAPFSLVFAAILLPLVAILFGHFERWRLRITGHGVVPNGHIHMSGARFTEKLKVRFTEVATWREVASLLLGGVISVLAAIVIFIECLCLCAAALLFWSLAVVRETINIWYPKNAYWQVMTNEDITQYRQYNIPFDPNINPDNPQWQLTHNQWWLPVLLILVGVFVFAYINGVMAGASASLSKMVLSPRPEEFERKLAQLSKSRSTIMNSFESERRRIERNLHDGVQQELVNISLRLGLTEMEAKRLVAAGHPAQNLQAQVAQSKADLAHALETLRNTVRGIYPAVLEDHGLHAALEELAHHTLVPTQLHYQVRERPHAMWNALPTTPPMKPLRTRSSTLARP